jgi:superfamily II DNA/RNA helicase
VVGRNVPPPIEGFKKLQDEFSLAPALVQNLQASGYIHPTPIQMQAIPIMLQVWICCLDIFSYYYGSAAKNQEKHMVYW